MNATPITEPLVLDALRGVLDPEIGMNIVDLGLIYDVQIAGAGVRVMMTLTSAGCPMGESIRHGVEQTLLQLGSVTAVHAELVFDPPWHPGMIAPNATAA